MARGGVAPAQIYALPTQQQPQSIEEQLGYNPFKNSGEQVLEGSRPRGFRIFGQPEVETPQQHYIQQGHGFGNTYSQQDPGPRFAGTENGQTSYYAKYLDKLRSASTLSRPYGAENTIPAHNMAAINAGPTNVWEKRREANRVDGHMHENEPNRFRQHNQTDPLQNYLSTKLPAHEQGSGKYNIWSEDSLNLNLPKVVTTAVHGQNAVRGKQEMQDPVFDLDVSMDSMLNVMNTNTKRLNEIGTHRLGEGDGRGRVIEGGSMAQYTAPRAPTFDSMSAQETIRLYGQRTNSPGLGRY